MVYNSIYMSYSTIMKKHAVHWLECENIERTLNARCHFCREWDFKPMRARPWVSQPFPVLSMITRGNGAIVIADKPQHTVMRTPLRPCYLPANVRRQPVADDEEGLTVLALGVSFEVLGGVELLNFFRIPPLFEAASDDHLREILSELHTRESSAAIDIIQNIAARKKLLFELLGELLENAPPPSDTALPFMEANHCGTAITYLNENFASPLDVAKLMSLCNISRTHFFRLFKRQTTMTPFEYLKQLRMQEAQRLLLGTALSIAEIGATVGWEDQFHFSRSFKGETGLSPRQYRTQYRHRHFLNRNSTRLEYPAQAKRVT